MPQRPSHRSWITAKDEYRRRLRELDDELKAAALAGNVGREEAADTERAALLRSFDERWASAGGTDRWGRTRSGHG